MKHSTTKRTMPVRLVITYILMTISVIAIVIVLTLALLGYRFNSAKGTLTQGGLVQFISQPSGAKVTVGSATLSQLTRTKITLNPGQYLAKMDLEGYQTWQKNVSVKSGTVLWLNSAHFVPSNPVTSPVLTTPTIASAQARPGGKYFALLKSATTPIVTLVSTDKDEVETEDVSLPETAFAAGKTHHFELEKWNDDNKHLLIKHTVDGKTQYVVMNVDQPEKSLVIASDETNLPAKILFDPRSDDSVIILYANGEVRTQKLSDGKRSDVLIQNVSDMSLSSATTLLYSSKPVSGVVTTGYLTLGAEKSKVFESVTTTEPVHVSGGEYYGNFYFATSVGKTVKIQKYENFATSDAEAEQSGTLVRELTLPSSASFISFKGGNRFVVIQAAKTQTTYDLELAQQTDTTIQGASSLKDQLVWLDSYHFWSDADGKLRQYEFDGTNQTDVTNVTAGYSAVYSPNQKYLYSIGKDDSGKMRVQRTLMVIK